MHHAYITRRVAPQGYVAVTRPLAEILFERGHRVTICSDKVNEFDVFDRHKMGFTVSKATADRPFALLVYDFRQTMPPTMRKNCVYYAESHVTRRVIEEMRHANRH